MKKMTVFDRAEILLNTVVELHTDWCEHKESVNRIDFEVGSHKAAVAEVNKWGDAAYALRMLWSFFGCHAPGVTCEEIWNAYPWFQKLWDNDYTKAYKMFEKMVEISDKVGTFLCAAYSIRKGGTLSNRDVTENNKVVYATVSLHRTGHYRDIAISFANKTHTKRDDTLNEFSKVYNELVNYCGTVASTPLSLSSKVWIQESMSEREWNHKIEECKKWMEAEMELCTEKQAMWVSKKMEIPMETAQKLNKMQASEILGYFFNDDTFGVEEKSFLEHYRKIVNNL